MLRYAALILVILIIALQVKLWTGQGGMRDVWALTVSVADQGRDNAVLTARNDALAADVADLKQGDEAVEERARTELGLIKPGETFYQVVDTAQVPAAPAAAPKP